MRNLIWCGLALSALVLAAPRPAAAQAKAWCTNESGFTRECYWDTQEQCAEEKLHLAGGSCYRNPSYAGPQSAAPHSARSVRPKTHRHTAER